MVVPASIWRSIAERFWLACLVTAIFFLIVGATGTVPFVSQAVANVYFQVLLLIIGLLMLGFSLYAGVTATEVDPGRKQTTEPRSNNINPKTYGIVIVAPKEGIKITPPVKIQGTIKAKLADLELWLVNVGEADGADAYWPQRQVHPEKNNKWSVTYTPPPGFGDGDRRRLRLYLVGKDGQALIKAFRKTHEVLAQPQGLKWVGLTKLTSDMILACDQLQIVLASPKPPEPGPAMCGSS